MLVILAFVGLVLYVDVLFVMFAIGVFVDEKSLEVVEVFTETYAGCHSTIWAELLYDMFKFFFAETIGFFVPADELSIYTFEIFPDVANDTFFDVAINVVFGILFC